MQDIFIACVDGLKGFSNAIEGGLPPSRCQLCIVHLVRNSLNFVLWKLQKEVAADLKCIYNASTVDEAEWMLTQFEIKGDKDLYESRKVFEQQVAWMKRQRNPGRRWSEECHPLITLTLHPGYKWNSYYSSIGLSWRRHWAHITPFFDYPTEIRTSKSRA